MIHLEFDRIPPGAEIGPPHRGGETITYLAAGEVVVEEVPGPGPRLVIRAGDVLYEAPSRVHVVRNEARIDALALRAAVDIDPAAPPRPGSVGSLEGPPVRRREGARVLEQGGMRQRVLVEPGDFGTASFTVSEIELAPGATTGWHRHQRSEHVLVVFEGRGTVRVGAVEETIEPLKGVRVEMGLPHAISNTGRTPLRYYMCATPAADPLSDREDVDPPR